MACNTLPEVPAEEKAIWRRINVINFHNVPEPEKDISSKWGEELGKILTKTEEKELIKILEKKFREKFGGKCPEKDWSTIDSLRQTPTSNIKKKGWKGLKFKEEIDVEDISDSV
ncbi:hypothetical protein DFJ73DRAFT_760291 [Zopfochytrium polystomum]|nr:hypothetical protein DFJ73DRAFT_760291 [Zopfochytrium polystomum]